MTALKQCQDKRKWDDYVIEHSGHPLQLWGWGEVKSAHNWTAHRLFFYDKNEDIIGAVQLLTRKLPWPFKSIAYVPRGPVVDTNNREELLVNLASYVKKHYHSVALSVEPDDVDFNLPTGWIKSVNKILPAETIILDLTKSDSELLANMAKKTRQYIRKSTSEKISIKLVRTEADLKKCLEIYHQTAQRAGFKLHSDDYYYDVANKMNDYSPVFAAYSDDQPIAFLWLAISADTAFELYGGVNELGQQLRVNYALKWYAIQKCREWGLTRYDFGGLIDGGVSTFKLGWADKETRLAGTFDRPLSIFYNAWTNLLPKIKKLVRKFR